LKKNTNEIQTEEEEKEEEIIKRSRR